MHPHTALAALLALALLAGCAPAGPAPATPAGPLATAQRGAAPTEAQPSPAPLVTEAATGTPAPLAAPTAALPPIPTEGPPALAAPSATPELPEPTISAQDGNDLALLRTVGWGSVNAAVIAPDRKLIAAGTTAGVVLIRLPELEHLRLYRVAGGVKDLAFSPGGGLLAVVGAATELRRVADWSPVATLSGDTPLFSPDGQTVATQQSKPSQMMLLWRVDGQPLARVPDERAVAFSPDGALLATRAGAKVLVRRGADGASLRELDGSGPAFSPDGKLLALISPDVADVQLWSADDILSARQPVRRLASGLAPAKSEGALAFGPDGQRLIAAVRIGEPGDAAQKSALRAWQLADGSLSVRRECDFCEQRLSRYGTFTVETQYPNGLGPIVTAIKRTADGETLSSFESFAGRSDSFAKRTLRPSADKTVGVADLELALQEDGVPFELDLPGFETIGYTPDAQTLIGAGPDLTLWDVTTGALRVWHKPRQSVWEGGPVPPNRYQVLGRVVVALWDQLGPTFNVSAMAWDAQTGEELWQAHTPETLPGGPVLAWAFNTDGSYALAQGTQARLYPRAGAPQVIAMTSTVSALAFSPDGAALAVGDRSGQVQIMSAGDAKNIGGLRLPGGAVAGLGFSPDGKRLAVFDQQGDVTLLRSLEDQAPATISGGQALRGVTFSPDGTTIGLQSQSGGILVWRDAPGAAQVRLQGAPTSTLTFSYDNQILLVAEESGLAIYRLADGALLRRLDGTAQLSAVGPRRRLIGLLRDGLVEQWGVRR